jgi:hypothetical protein
MKERNRPKEKGFWSLSLGAKRGCVSEAAVGSLNRLRDNCPPVGKVVEKKKGNKFP